MAAFDAGKFLITIAFTLDSLVKGKRDILVAVTSKIRYTADGYAFCRAVRADERTAKIPVIIVSARDGDADIVAGLEVGADDYSIKPFSGSILSTRVRAVLRRSTVKPDDR